MDFRLLDFTLNGCLLEERQHHRLDRAEEWLVLPLDSGVSWEIFPILTSLYTHGTFN